MTVTQALKRELRDVSVKVGALALLMLAFACCIGYSVANHRHPAIVVPTAIVCILLIFFLAFLKWSWRWVVVNWYVRADRSGEWLRDVDLNEIEAIFFTQGRKAGVFDWSDTLLVHDLFRPYRELHKQPPRGPKPV